MKARFLIPLLFSVLAERGGAQPGKDGVHNVVVPSEVINLYCPVTSNISSGSNTIQILSSVFFPLCQGDLIMVYQAQGASMDITNTSAYGSITANNSAGSYEFCYVQSVNGNIISIQTTFTNSYQVSGKVQVIKVPQYSTLTINSSSAINPRPWKDTTVSTVLYRIGGILAIHATNIINNGTITASAFGFRGGALFYNSSSQTNPGITSIVTTFSTSGGEKGEGIFGYQSDYDNNGGRYCMGAPANGGGGGNAHNAGGGGGANGNSGNAWTGQGVMIVNTSNPIGVWSLTSGYIQNSNAPTTSSGGGHGGYSWGGANGNALISPPGNQSAWGGDARREVGGIGGRPLSTINSETSIYFGGGGGAPEANNSASAAGSNGGGIVYLIATNNISGNGYIFSNGANAGNTSGCSCDGAPGAGAGGSIVVKTPTIVTSQTVSAIGGNGGSQLTVSFPGNPNSESEGTGGGGGGGFVAISSGSIIPSVAGGLNGTSLSLAVTEMNSNGATAGNSGQIGTVTSGFISYIYAQTSQTTACEGSTVILNSPSTGTSYSWSGPGGFSSSANPAVINNINLINSGGYSLSVLNAQGCGTSAIFSVTVLPKPILSVPGKTICNGSSATLSVSGASTYTWSLSQNTSTTTATLQVTPFSTTIYTVTGLAANGCRATTTVQVKVDVCDGIEEYSENPEVIIYPNPNDGTFIIRCDKEVELNIVNALGKLVRAVTLLDSNNRQANISGLNAGIYFVVANKNYVKLNSKLIVLK